MGKPEGRRPLGKHRPRREYNNKMHLREEGCNGLEGINLAHGRDRRRPFGNTVINLRVPYNMGNLICSVTNSLSSKSFLHGAC
jgi:hypothetical protein